MNASAIEEELQRITEQLTDVLYLVTEDCHSFNERDRYNVGILVGIGYAHNEIKRLIRRIEQSKINKNSIMDR